MARGKEGSGSHRGQEIVREIEMQPGEKSRLKAETTGLNSKLAGPGKDRNIGSYQCQLLKGLKNVG